MKAETKNNSYNPFKMWGSWVGVVISVIFLLFFVLPPTICYEGEASFCKINFAPQVIIGYAIIIIVFLIMGWLVHSIFRYINNKNNNR